MYVLGVLTFVFLLSIPIKVVEEKPQKPSLREKQQNGGLHDDGAAHHRKPERSVGAGRGGVLPAEPDHRQRLEAERKLEDMKRRRDGADSEEFEKMKQKQQEAEADLEMLKKKREERRRILEEEEKQKEQEMADKKAKEQEERRKMKEEIERRRAEAAEKKKQMQEEGSVNGKPAFTCVTPKSSSKIGERAEFLNKSAQKTSIRTSHTPIVSKIGDRLEQYATAAQGNREVRSPRCPAGDLPVGGTRNIKSMWERGDVLGPSESPSSTNKDAAGIKVGVAGRVNDWLAKPPEAGKAVAAAPPSDLKPGDVTNKRGLWETKKSSAPAKVTEGSKSKSVTNAGMRH